MNKKILIGLLVIVGIIFISGCAQQLIERPDKIEKTQIANPASVYCEKQGYTLEIRTNEGGSQTGYCIFDDGTECEEWAYFRGECPIPETKATPKPTEKSETKPPEEAKNLIEGKTLDERLSILKRNLHTEGSGDEAKKYFPDFVKVYVDEDNLRFPSMVSPFTYYYSEEADITVSICNIDFTVFICEGKLDRLIEESDYDRCDISDEYLHPEKYGS